MAKNTPSTLRYDINNDPKFTGKTNMMFANNVNTLRNDTLNMANKHKKLIEDYIKKMDNM